jgi:hypothetical protein
MSNLTTSEESDAKKVLEQIYVSENVPEKFEHFKTLRTKLDTPELVAKLVASSNIRDIHADLVLL